MCENLAMQIKAIFDYILNLIEKDLKLTESGKYNLTQHIKEVEQQLLDIYNKS